MIAAIGLRVIRFVEETGRVLTVLGLGLLGVFTPPWRPRAIIKQMEFVGVQSVGIILLTGFFTGAVFALQAEYGFSLFGAATLTGSTVAIALAKELGPTLTALMVTGRAGSAMAAEIGTMRVTEQIDALEAMAVDPMEYLVGPRLVAGVVMMPVLAAIFTAIGLVGTYIAGVYVLGIPEGPFLYRVTLYLDPDDFTTGLAKAAVFGVIVSSVGCARGLYARGGAAGVGRATTQAVVTASVSVLVVDYFLTRWWL